MAVFFMVSSRIVGCDRPPGTDAAARSNPRMADDRTALQNKP
jgi:hypothetical protein